MISIVNTNASTQHSYLPWVCCFFSVQVGCHWPPFPFITAVIQMGQWQCCCRRREAGVSQPSTAAERPQRRIDYVADIDGRMRTLGADMDAEEMNRRFTVFLYTIHSRVYPTFNSALRERPQLSSSARYYWPAPPPCLSAPRRAAPPSWRPVPAVQPTASCQTAWVAAPLWARSSSCSSRRALASAQCRKI